MFNKNLVTAITYALLGMSLAAFLIISFAEAADGPNRSICEPMYSQLKDKSIKGEKRDKLRKEFSLKCSYE
jgi:hypothetical protein